MSSLNFISIEPFLKLFLYTRINLRLFRFRYFETKIYEFFLLNKWDCIYSKQSKIDTTTGVTFVVVPETELSTRPHSRNFPAFLNSLTVLSPCRSGHALLPLRTSEADFCCLRHFAEVEVDYRWPTWPPIRQNLNLRAKPRYLSSKVVNFARLLVDRRLAFVSQSQTSKYLSFHVCFNTGFWRSSLVFYAKNMCF